MAYTYDPISNLIPRIDPVGDVMRRVLPPGFRKQREAEDVQLDDVERESLIKRAGKQIGNWVGTVGNLLDLPGSTARDVIAGVKTGDWSKYNPFDQLLTPFSPDNRVTGQKLLSDVFGVIDDKDTWTNFGLGLGADILTDPLTFISGGPLTKAGGILRKTGHLDDVGRIGNVGKRVRQMGTTLGDVYKTLQDPLEKAAIDEAITKAGTTFADVADKPLRAGWSVFGNEIPAGPLGRKWAGLKDTIGTGIANSWPGRATKFLFDHATQGTLTAGMQAAARGATRAAEKGQALHREAATKIMEQTHELYDNFAQAFPSSFADGSDMRELADAGMVRDPNIESRMQEVIRATGELATKGGRSWDQAAGEAIQEIMGAPVAGTPDIGRVVDIAKQFKSLNDEVFNQIVEYGGYTQALDSDLIQHMARFGTKEKSAEMFGHVRRLAVSGDFMRARAEAVRELPSFVVNKLGNDAMARVDKGRSFQDVTNYIQQTYAKWLNPNDPNHAAKVAGFLNEANAKAPLGYTQRKMGNVFGNSFDNLIDYSDKSQKVLANIKAVHNVLAENIRTDGAGVPLKEAFAKVGLKGEEIVTHDPNGLPLPTPQKLGEGSKAYFQFLKEKGQQYAQDTVDPSIIGDVKSFLDKTTRPEWERTLFKALDEVTGWFTRNLTVPFPSFTVRNFGSGQMANMLSGEVPISKIPKYMSDLAWAEGVLHGRNKLTSAADKELMKEVFIHKVYHWGDIDDVPMRQNVVNTAPVPYQRPIPPPVFSKDAWAGDMANVDLRYANVQGMVPGLGGKALGSPLVSGPTKLAGKGYETWAGAGQRAAQQAEFLNRVPMYKYLRDEGWSAAAAANRVKELQVDYGKLSPFEKTYIRRKLIPFYTYTRKYGEEVVRTLMEQPGGPLSRTIQASNRLKRGDDATTPEYVANTLAIGGEKLDDGSRRYLTGFGLGHEDPLQFATALSGDWRGAGLELISRMNPMIKGPIEYFTGTSAFQRGSQGGRRLEDIDPLIGRIRSNLSDLATGERTYKAKPFLSDEFDMLMANMPFSRHLTTLRQLTDKRKWEKPIAQAANMFTGFKVTDVSPAAQDAMLQDRLNEMRRKLGGRSFGVSYFPTEIKAQMTPQEYADMLTIKALEKEMVLRKDERKKLKGF